MANKTIYVRDEDLWNTARELAGGEGLSNVIQTLLVSWVAAKKAELQRKAEMTEIKLEVSGGEYERDHEETDIDQIVFSGRLLADSEGLSADQMPRLSVYQNHSGKLILYRTWKGTPAHEMGANYSVYPSYEALASDRFALDTMWITGDPRKDEDADYTDEFLQSVEQALGGGRTLRID